MSLYQAKVLVRTTLAQAMTDSQTDMVLASGTGTRFPATTGGYYHLVIWNSAYGSPVDAYNQSPAKAEVVKVTSHDGSADTIATIDRAEQGTGAIAHSAGAIVDLVFGKAEFDWLKEAEVLDATDVYLAAPVDRFYVWGVHSAGFTATTATLSAAQIVAFPWVCQKTVTADYAIIQLNAAASTTQYKMAIHTAPSLTNIYPTTRVDASDALSVNDGGITGRYKWTFTSPITFNRGTLYWFSLLRDTGTSGNFFGVSRESFNLVQGVSSQGLGAAPSNTMCLTGLASAVGAYPFAGGIADPFPSGLTEGDYLIYMIGIHPTTVL